MGQILNEASVGKYQDRHIRAGLEYSYFGLISQDPNAVLDRHAQQLHLSLASSILQKMILALSRFYNQGDSVCFDPHVGDWLCQTRAVILAELAEQGYEKLESRLQELRCHLNTLQDLSRRYLVHNNYTFRSAHGRKPTLFEFCEHIGLHKLSFMRSEYIVTLCYLLHRYQTYNESKNIRRALPKTLCYEFNISTSMANGLIAKWRRELMRISTYFVMKNSAEYLPVCKYLLRSTANGSPYFPAFFVTLILMRYVKEKGILLQLTQRSSWRDATLAAEKPPGEDGLVPSVLLDVSKTVANSAAIGKQSPAELLLMSAANHPQYHGVESFSAYSELEGCKNPQYQHAAMLMLQLRCLYEYYLYRASEAGVSARQDGKLHINHVYFSRCRVTSGLLVA